jgi:hypothetical protein
MVQSSILSPRRTERDRRTDGRTLSAEKRCFILLSKIDRFLNGSRYEKEHTHKTIHTHSQHGNTQVPLLLP